MNNSEETLFNEWRAKFPTPGLQALIKTARIVERSTPTGITPATISELLAAIATSPPGSAEKLALESNLRSVRKELLDFAGPCVLAANAVFSGSAALALLRDDLVSMADAIERHRAQHDPADPLCVAMREFENAHLLPNIRLYGGAISALAAGRPFSGGLQPECCSYLLKGTDWHFVPVSP
jgi:hypothetical protein